jgi:hypothetical protein
MDIKIKVEHKDGILRCESKGEIKEILFKEDLVNPSKEKISLCFRGIYSSGIVDLTPDEAENLIKILKQKIHLVKGSKKFIGKGI